MTTNGKPAPYPPPDDDIPGWDDIPDTDFEHPEIFDSNKSRRTESGLTEIQDERMVARAVRNRWITEGHKRWPTNKTKVELEEIPEDERTLIEKTILSVFEAVSGSEPRSAGIAAKTAVTMEGQNQSDDHKLIPSQHEHSHQLTVDDRRSKLAAIDARLGTFGSGGVVVDEARGNGKSDHPAIRRVGGSDDDNGKS